MKYRTQKAYEYYAEHILTPYEAKVPIHEEHGFKFTVPFRDWEVFVALLTDDRGTGKSSGSDLQNHEVKSVSGTGGAEYQYHRNSGLEKLEHDKSLAHIVIAYRNGYRDLDVYVLSPEQFVEIAEAGDWRGRIWSAYHDPDGPLQQRCRLGIPFAEVQRLGEHIMTVRDGRLEENPAASNSSPPDSLFD